MARGRQKARQIADKADSNASQDLQKVVKDTPKTDNISELQDKMLSAIMLLEGSLFAQASDEYNRANRLREFSAAIEDELFRPEILELLPTKEKIKLYMAVNAAIKDSLNFLTNLHKSVAAGFEAVQQMQSISEVKEKQKAVALPSQEVDMAKIREVRRMLTQTLVTKLRKAQKEAEKNV